LAPKYRRKKRAYNVDKIETFFQIPLSFSAQPPAGSRSAASPVALDVLISNFEKMI